MRADVGSYPLQNVQGVIDPGPGVLYSILGRRLKGVDVDGGMNIREAGL